MTRSVVLRRAGLAGVAVTAAVLLSACGGDDSVGSGMGHGSGMATSAPAASASAGAGAVFNDADVMFAQMMVVHHRQAIEMASLAGTRAASSDVKALATKIKQAQQPEIDTMSGWLTAWGKPAPMASASGMDMGMSHGPMPGVMSDADMTQLAKAKGAEFDKQFLTMMISHHQGAITMAQQETAQGSNPDAKTLAAKIITDQQAEITQMQDLLKKV
ncbi:DUF305 domain-containing protein [Micromonospora orduensis]|uniref:DUF305 domain-containing protein n=1 Tax=Micromonospora orduensis TaxID=1420891 RepID=A0A5C4QT30_9ACTN|nr:DUF305 domain-containing protein [Micromonospora orduensis]